MKLRGFEYMHDSGAVRFCIKFGMWQKARSGSVGQCGCPTTRYAVDMKIATRFPTKEASGKIRLLRERHKAATGESPIQKPVFVGRP